jgi:hypothetical protein
LLPPAPLQLSVKFALALKAAVVSVPLSALLPLQPPEAVHEVASVEDHVSVVVAPVNTLVGLAVSVTVGVGVDAGDEPPPPPQAARTKLNSDRA